MIGRKADAELVKVRRTLKTIAGEIRRLEKQGILLAHVHFKTGTKAGTMYLLEPTTDGARKYHHVGKDPKAQAAARAKIERYKRREQLSRLLFRYRNELDRIEEELLGLLESAKRLEKGSRKEDDSFLVSWRRPYIDRDDTDDNLDDLAEG